MTINLEATEKAIRNFANSRIQRDGQTADVYAATCRDIINGTYTLDDPIGTEMVRWADRNGLTVR